MRNDSTNRVLHLDGPAVHLGAARVELCSSVSPAEVEQQREASEEQILDWRFEQLLCAGYERRQARVLSQRLEVDLHGAVDLVRRGCPPELALRILL